MTLPAIPSPATASLEVLRRACQSVQVWAEDCDDIDAAIDALAKVSAIETYLAKKGQDAEAQGAARRDVHTVHEFWSVRGWPERAVAAVW